MSEAVTSSAESDTEKDSPRQTKNLSETSPSQEAPDTESLQNTDEVDSNHADSNTISPVRESEHSHTELDS